MKEIKRGCKVCEKFAKHSYWSHMDSSRIYFLRKMEGMYMHSLTLPSEFSKNFKEPIGELMRLRLKTGTKTWYQVQVKRSDEGKLVLKKGWRDFVISNKIRKDDMLNFQYCNLASFEVTVYDNGNQCNWRPPVPVSNGEETSEDDSEEEKTSESSKSDSVPVLNGDQKSEDDSLQILDAPLKETISVSSYCKSDLSFKNGALKRVLEEHEEVYESEEVVRKRKRGRPRKNEAVKDAQSCKRTKMEFVTSSVPQDEQEEFYKGEKGLIRRSGGRYGTSKSMKDGTSSHASLKVKIEQVEDVGTKCQLGIMVQKDLRLTKDQKIIAYEMSRKAQIGNPTFVHLIRSRDFGASSYVTIPDKFAPEILKKAPRTIDVHCTGVAKIWKFWYHTIKDTRAIDGENWKKFINTNGLKKGDMCLFELMKDGCKTVLTMTVHIHRN